MKIAIDIREASGEKAGKGWYTFHIARNLLKIDQKNEYILYTKEKVPGFEEFDNVKIRQFNLPHLLWHKKVASDTKKEAVDIYFSPSSYITPALLPKTVKSVITVHDLVAFLFPTAHNKKAVFLEKLFFKKALKRSAHITAVSTNTKRDIINKFHHDESKISTIFCGAGSAFRPIKKETLRSFARQTKLPDKFFLAVGTIEPRKNYKRLIKAFAAVSKVAPNYHLIIVGKNGWQFEEVHEEIRKNYLGKKVHTLGYLSEQSLVKLYNLATALVFPSLYEGFGIPPLEAMSCGCPVIASNTSSIPEVVGDAGLLVNPENPEQLARAMHKLIKDDDLQMNLRNQGLIQARKFSWELSAKKLLEIFNSVIKMA
jgi:glycosyltransferase involved in cell wall biosynthesis